MNQPTNPSDGREHERKAVLFAAELLVGEKTIPCEIVNISFGGAQVRISKHLARGNEVSLIIDPFGTYKTEIRWVREPDVGLKFNDEQSKVAELVMAIATYA